MIDIKNVELIALQREIQIHEKLNHPNIIKLFGSFQRENKLYLVLELVESGNLFEMAKKQTLTEMEVITIFGQVVSAVAYLHEKKIIHRDIKPENILVGKSGVFKLCDFGFCAPYGDNNQRQTLCGTKEYLAPEVIGSQEQTDKVDIWCLGVLLYELVHKKPPYSADNIMQLANLIKTKSIGYRSTINEDLKTIIQLCLRLEPHNRPSANFIMSNFSILGHSKNTSVRNEIKQKHARISVPNHPTYQLSKTDYEEKKTRFTNLTSTINQIDPQERHCSYLSSYPAKTGIPAQIPSDQSWNLKQNPYENVGRFTNFTSKIELKNNQSANSSYKMSHLSKNYNGIQFNTQCSIPIFNQPEHRGTRLMNISSSPEPVIIRRTESINNLAQYQKLNKETQFSQGQMMIQQVKSTQEENRVIDFKSATGSVNEIKYESNGFYSHPIRKVTSFPLTFEQPGNQRKDSNQSTKSSANDYKSSLMLNHQINLKKESEEKMSDTKTTHLQSDKTAQQLKEYNRTLESILEKHQRSITIFEQVPISQNEINKIIDDNEKRNQQSLTQNQTFNEQRIVKKIYKYSVNNESSEINLPQRCYSTTNKQNFYQTKIENKIVNSVIHNFETQENGENKNVEKLTKQKWKDVSKELINASPVRNLETQVETREMQRCLKKPQFDDRFDKNQTQNYNSITSQQIQTQQLAKPDNNYQKISQSVPNPVGCSGFRTQICQTQNSQIRKTSENNGSAHNQQFLDLSNILNKI